jgi:hypothetical protein
VDPDTLNPDLETNPDTIRIQGFDDQTLKKKKYSRNFLKSFLIKNCTLLMSKLQEKPSSLKREHPALQKMKFNLTFLPSWIRIRIANPDPDMDPATHLNPDLIRIWIRIRIHSTAF